MNSPRLWFLVLGLMLSSLFSGHAGEKGVPVTYQLPVEGSLPRTFLVTLAITDRGNPDWIVSTFVAGQPRTVTKENQGKFTEIWDGLDENFMPVPPGEYGVKGIFAPADIWPVDGEWHAITPLFAGGVSPWLPAPGNPDHWKLPVPFHGDPVNSPLRDVDVAANGVGVFYYQYLENGKNCPMFDLKKPVNYDQFLTAFNSGGAAGGPCVATDGESVWAFSSDGGPRFVYRADGKSFGDGAAANRRNTYLPDGWVTGMAAWRDTQAAKSYVYVAQRGKIVTEDIAGSRQNKRYVESKQETVDKITVHDGDNGAVLASINLARPQSVVVRGDLLYALHQSDQGWEVAAVPLKGGRPQGTWETVFKVPASMTPFDLEVDRSGRFYVSDTDANKVFQFDSRGAVLRTFGRLSAQKPGTYDRETLMAPGKLATWTDADGKDRLIITEYAGPNRVSEWSADDGKLLREFATYQTKANNGYAIDPDDASLIYLPGQGDWLTRFKVNYDTHEWTVDAVWPGVESGQRKGLDKPVAIRANGSLFLASEQNLTVYRLAGDRWIRSAGVVQKDKDWFLWHDENGNGESEDNEQISTVPPKGALTYHGQKWLADLSYLCLEQGGKSAWRLAPDGFDGAGNPIFNKWEKVWTDPVFEARAAGTADAVHGGNELADAYTSDWMQADGSTKNGFYAQARGGKNFTANFGAQHKISRYVPDGSGGYRLKWRVGRTKLGAQAGRGEIEGGMRLFKPVNGLVTVVDQSRSGLFLYTEDGLYVDTIFAPGSAREGGIYAQPGEFFAGSIYPNARNGKVYYAAGKYTPFLYEMQNWSLTQNPVRKLTSLPPVIRISSSQIADPPEIALSLRGGAGKTSVARFAPALGGVELDGSLTGWESAEPVHFGAGKDQDVEVRCLYDPDHIYLRWHVRLGTAFQPAPLPPLERIFTHDQAADTLGFYIQGDRHASSGGPASGRPGDVRMVFGLFKNGEKLEPVAVGLYPDWKGKGRSQVYRTPVGEAAFVHVGSVAGAKLGGVVDPDSKGFVISASIPRNAIPALNEPLSESLRTLVNFDANLGGHNKIWWANSDGSANRETYDEPTEARLYPGSWAPAIFQGIADGVAIRNWMIIGPFGGPGTEKFSSDPRENKEAVRRFYEAASFPPDDGAVDVKVVFEGPMIQGYWKNPGRVSWKPATIAEMDTRVVLGSGCQVWYGATWVYAPAETALEFKFLGHKMTPIRWFLNGQQIPIPDKDYKDDNFLARLSASREVVLKEGWNRIVFRAYNFGYAPFKVGLLLQASPEKLWPLRFSGTPPAMLNR